MDESPRHNAEGNCTSADPKELLAYDSIYGKFSIRHRSSVVKAVGRAVTGEEGTGGQGPQSSPLGGGGWLEMFHILTEAGSDSAGVCLCKNLLHPTCKSWAFYVIYSFRETERERGEVGRSKEIDEKKTGAEQGEVSGGEAFRVE